MKILVSLCPPYSNSIEIPMEHRRENSVNFLTPSQVEPSLFLMSNYIFSISIFPVSP